MASNRCVIDGECFIILWKSVAYKCDIYDGCIGRLDGVSKVSNERLISINQQRKSYWLLNNSERHCFLGLSSSGGPAMAALGRFLFDAPDDTILKFLLVKWEWAQKVKVKTLPAIRKGLG